VWLLAHENPSGPGARIDGYRPNPGQPIVDGVGLTYRGWGGVAHATFHGIALVAACVLVLRRRPRTRVLGLCVLTASALLWVTNGVYMMLHSSFQVFGWATGAHGAVFVFGAVLLIDAYRDRTRRSAA